MRYEHPRLDIEKYKSELDEKARGLATIYKNLHLRLNVKTFDFVKHLKQTINTFLKENSLSQCYKIDARKYIVWKARQIKIEENRKKTRLKQGILFKEKNNLERKV